MLRLSRYATSLRSASGALRKALPGRQLPLRQPKVFELVP